MAKTVADFLLERMREWGIERSTATPAMGSTQARSAPGSGFHQEVDLQVLFKDAAHEYVQMITVPEQLPEVIDRAIRIAKDQRSVTCVIVPNDLQGEDAVEPEDMPRAHGYAVSGIGYTRPRVLPGKEQLRRAADALNSGEKVAMLVGAGVLGAEDEVAARILGVTLKLVLPLSRASGRAEHSRGRPGGKSPIWPIFWPPGWAPGNLLGAKHAEHLQRPK